VATHGPCAAAPPAAICASSCLAICLGSSIIGIFSNILLYYPTDYSHYWASYRTVLNGRNRVPAPFCFSPAVWHKAKTAVVEILIELARRPGLEQWERRIVYSDLTREIEIRVPEVSLYYRDKKLNALLNEVAEASREVADAAISSLVVRKGKGTSGKGLAKLIGRETGSWMGSKVLSTRQETALRFLNRREADQLLNDMRSKGS